MRFALIGQPNCGKSTLFNHVAGYKAETGNFAGTTVTYTESKILVLGEKVDLVDLPGTYSLSGMNPAEKVTLQYLTSCEVSVIINVIDASRLAQGLGLTVELLEMQKPLLVALNMMDEAAREGMTIDIPKLQSLLGTPVVPLVARKGRGVRNLFVTAHYVTKKDYSPKRLTYSKDLEEIILEIAGNLDRKAAILEPEPFAIKLLEGDIQWQDKIHDDYPQLLPIIKSSQISIEKIRGQSADLVVSGERQVLATNLASPVVQQGERRISWRDRIDDILLHPVFGYVALVLIMFIFFEIVYGIGSILETPLLGFFSQLEGFLDYIFGADTLLGASLIGIVQGIAGGVAIVFPYLVPFLLGLGFLEDVGYLPRIAFLMDTLMKRIGLQGNAIVPFILGYGCNVPAVMSTRMLENRRDRFLAAALSTLVPCAARIAVVFGLVAFYLGPTIALAIYFFNLVVIAITGRILSGLLPEKPPGLILEMPVYQIPTFRNVIHKTWFRLHEFVVEAWPILIAGSLVLAILIFHNLDNIINNLVRPITWILGLPAAVGLPLIFGILRKELSLVMLYQAFGGVDFSYALTSVQLITYAVFVVFYIPCLATLAVLKRELGTRNVVIITLLTVVIAMIAAQIARLLAIILL
ncbi:ferrous iron transport protein B [Chloroflexota bacterium]